MGIDHARGHGCAAAQAEVRRSGGGQALSQRRAWLHHRSPDAGEALVGRCAESNGAEIAFAPASFVRQVSLLASHGARGAGQVAARPPSQEIGEIHELPGGREDVGTVLEQPQKLGRLHLG